MHQLIAVAVLCPSLAFSLGLAGKGLSGAVLRATPSETSSSPLLVEETPRHHAEQASRIGEPKRLGTSAVRRVSVPSDSNDTGESLKAAQHHGRSSHSPPHQGLSEPNDNDDVAPRRIQHRDTHDNESWIRGWSSAPGEFCVPLDVRDFPSDLVGTFFQNGPGLFERGADRIMHPFDADGMVKAVTFLGPSGGGQGEGNKNRAWFRNRFVATREFRQEAAANRLLYRGVFGTAKNQGAFWSNVGDLRSKNVANTNVLFTRHNQRLFALWEAGRPYEMDPVTLRTVGESWSFGDRYSAHYKVDPETNRLCNFCIYFGKPNPMKTHELVVMEHDGETGRQLYRRSFSLPGIAIGHDMAITRNWFVFFRSPCVFDPIPFLMGRKGPAQCFTWDDAAASSTLHLVPRDGGGRGASVIPISIEIPPCFCFHVCNAFEDERNSRPVVVVDVVAADRMFMAQTDAVRYPDNPITETMDWIQDGPPPFQLRRFVVDLSERRVISQSTLSVLSGNASSIESASATVDFPVIHPKVVGKPYRYAFLGGSASPSVVGPMQGLLKVDVLQGFVVDKWLPEPHEFLSEVTIVPRERETETGKSSQKDDTAEDFAYLLGYLVNGRDQTSELVVFDASQVSAGPISRSSLPFMTPHSLHGTFVPGFAPVLTDRVQRTFVKD